MQVRNRRFAAGFVLFCCSAVVLSAQTTNVAPPAPPGFSSVPSRPRTPEEMRQLLSAQKAAPVVPPPAISTPVVRPPVAAQPVPTPQAPPKADAPALAWDAEMKEYTAKAGEMTAPFTFNLTNVSSSEIIINSVQTSCGCTVAQLPSQPWHLAPGSNGEIKVSVNLAGKSGTVVKQVTAHTSIGPRMVQVKVNIPPPSPALAD